MKLFSPLKLSSRGGSWCISHRMLYHSPSLAQLAVAALTVASFAFGVIKSVP